MNKLVYYKTKNKGLKISCWLGCDFSTVDRGHRQFHSYVWDCGQVEDDIHITFRCGQESMLFTRYLTGYKALPPHQTHSVLTQLSAQEADRKGTIF